MEKNRLLIILILVIITSSIIVYFGYSDSQSNQWDRLSCEEQFDFAMSPEHQELTMEQHMEFHKGYDTCIQNPRMR
jgi:hypothetical protein